MKLTSRLLSVIVIVMLFGGIFFSSALGWWETVSTKEAAVYTEGEFAGQANPADIRGSYTFGDVEKNFDVPAQLLAQAFVVEADDLAGYPVKELEVLYAGREQEVGTASVRLFVALYKGLPYDLSTDIYLPESAAALLLQQTLNEEQDTYVRAHTVPDPEPIILTEAVEPLVTPEVNPTPASSGEPESGEGYTSEDRLIKGKTTFGELLEWGMTREAIELVLGMPIPASPGIKVKDFCTQTGLSFETVKSSLQAEVDQLP